MNRSSARPTSVRGVSPAGHYAFVGPPAARLIDHELFVRDAASADADLQQALGDALRRARPAGALLFTCNGRGTNMFPEP